MTRSSGGSRQPNRPNKDDQSRRDDVSDEDVDYDDNGNNNGSSSSASRSRPARRAPMAGSAHRAAPETSGEPGVVDPKRRGIALMADVILFFAVTMLISPIIAFISTFIPFQIITFELIMILLLLVRDYQYQGRGIGKNLMGLQVVDYSTGLPPSLLQSVKRNMLFFVATLLMGLVALLKYLPIDKTAMLLVSQIVGFVCSAYVLVLIPAECYFALRGAGGRRIGDKFANTHVIESSMDFSKFN